MSTQRQIVRSIDRLIVGSLRGLRPLIDRSFDRLTVRSFLAAGLVAFSISQPVRAQVGTCDSPQAEAYLDINNVRARLFNNGALFWRGMPHSVSPEEDRYEVPKGGGTQALFTQVFHIGGLVDGQLRVSAARYGNYEFWAGPLDERDGSPPDDCDVFDRIYVVSKADVAAYEADSGSTDDLRDWPTGLGAPTIDSAGSRIEVMDEPLSSRVDRVIDLDAGERPAFIGDLMAWWVMNDAGNQHHESETPPVGVEVHVTAFAFDVPGPLNETTFYRYHIFYRGASRLDSAYVGIFQDMDLGNFDDDYIGVDTTLGLAMAYNADNVDEGERGYGLAPPAVGLDFVRGPTVPSRGESASVGDARVADKPNRHMTSFMWFYNIDVPRIATAYYGYMQARWPYQGTRLTYGDDGTTQGNLPTNFMYPRDPVTRSYWSEFYTDGQGRSSTPSDRTHYSASGPFAMEPGDEQEIIVAVVWARGRDHLDSVTELRRADRIAQAVADANFDVSLPRLDTPVLSAFPSNGAISLAWSNPDSSNNSGDGFTTYAHIVGAAYEFEGYDVFAFDSPDDSVGTRIATYDKFNFVRRVVDGKRAWWPESDTSRFIAAEGRDTGLAHEHLVGGLDNHRTYHFGVQAYAYQDGYYPKVIRSEMARVSVEPRRDLALIDSAGALDARDVLDAIGVVQNPYMASSAYEVSRGIRIGESGPEVRFVNVPAGSSIRVFTVGGSLIKTLRQVGAPGDSGGSAQSMIPPQSVHWDLTNNAGRRLSGGVYLVHVDVPGVGQRVLKFSMVEGG